jgi:serine/threonine protein kinase
MILQRPHHFGVDWWALGIIVFEFLAGSTPFDGDSIEAIMRNILHAQIPYALLPEDTSPAAQSFIAALLRRDDDARLGARGARIVKRHAFFADIDWSTLLEAATGFQPMPDSDTDTSYFMDHRSLPPTATSDSEDLASSAEGSMPSTPSTPPTPGAPFRASPLALHAAGPGQAEAPPVQQQQQQPSSPLAALPTKDRVGSLKVETRARSGSSPPRFKLAREFQFVNVKSLEEQNARAQKEDETNK